MYSIEIKKIDELKYGRREAINSLKTNIKFAGTDIKVVEITSCGPNEGKSATSFELAKAFAESGEKTVLIDADMRKSVMIQERRIDNKGQKVGGLTHYLSGQGSMKEVVSATNIHNLFMVLAGPLSPNPTELLNGDKFDILLDALKKNFDLIIIDSPPLGAVIDSAIMAPKCDGVVLVLESGSTSAKTASAVIKQLEMTECKILGCVLNKVPTKGGKGYYKYKYYGEYK